MARYIAFYLLLIITVPGTYCEDCSAVSCYPARNSEVVKVSLCKLSLATNSNNFGVLTARLLLNVWLYYSRNFHHYLARQTIKIYTV
jgi:hypothetical protein